MCLLFVSLSFTLLACHHYTFSLFLMLLIEFYRFFVCLLQIFSVIPTLLNKSVQRGKHKHVPHHQCNQLLNDSENLSNRIQFDRSTSRHTHKKRTQTITILFFGANLRKIQIWSLNWLHSKPTCPDVFEAAAMHIFCKIFL